MSDETIPFNRPYLTGKELGYIVAAKQGNKLAGDGPYTKRCHAWLEERTGCAKALLTHSCTAALEMSALLLDIQPGDEVIMPSYTSSRPRMPSCCAAGYRYSSTSARTRSTSTNA